MELSEKNLAFPKKNDLEKANFGVTANLFTVKQAIETVGSFDETLKFGGDYEWGQRVYKAGYNQVYGEKAQVAHPTRSTFFQPARPLTV